MTNVAVCKHTGYSPRAENDIYEYTHLYALTPQRERIDTHTLTPWQPSLQNLDLVQAVIQAEIAQLRLALLEDAGVHCCPRWDSSNHQSITHEATLTRVWGEGICVRACSRGGLIVYVCHVMLGRGALRSRLVHPSCAGEKKDTFLRQAAHVL